jgi:hypothetical protein
MHMQCPNGVQQHAYRMQAANHSRRCWHRVQIHCRLYHWCTFTSLTQARSQLTVSHRTHQCLQSYSRKAFCLGLAHWRQPNLDLRASRSAPQSWPSFVPQCDHFQHGMRSCPDISRTLALGVAQHTSACQADRIRMSMLGSRGTIRRATTALCTSISSRTST